MLRLDRAEEARLLGEARAQAERVGFGRVLEMPAGDLPLGQQRVVEIARALCLRPHLLLLDEPAAGLRLAEKQLLAALLRQLRAEGMGVLLVAHDMDFVMELADSVVVTPQNQPAPAPAPTAQVQVAPAPVAASEQPRQQMEEQRQPVPLAVGVGLTHLAQSLDDEAGVGQGVHVVLERTVLGVKRHGQAVALGHDDIRRRAESRPRSRPLQRRGRRFRLDGELHAADGIAAVSPQPLIPA